jgi:hypothetical protein
MSDHLLVHGGFGGGWVWERPRPKLAVVADQVADERESSKSA